MKRNLKLLAAFAVGAAVVIFASWLGGWDFERGRVAVITVACSVIFGAICAGAANDFLEAER